MAKSYCKWPVIVGIIVGSVVLLAVLACIINCLCCGYQCCKCCCSCCCPSGRRRNKTPKHFDDFHQPPPAPSPVYQPPPAPPSYRGAQQSAPSFRGAQQTAHFDAPKSPAHVNEDALPEMPTWAGAVDKHVEDPNHRDDVEMEPLNSPDRKQAGTPGVAYSNYPPNPIMGAGAAAAAVGYRGFGPTDPRARRSPGPGAALNPVQDPYGRPSPGTPSPGGAIDPYGRRSPGPAALSAAQDPYGRRSPGPTALAATQDPYGRRSPGMSPAPAPAAGYGAAAHDPYGSRSPGVTSPVGAPVHNPYDQQQYQDSYDDHSYGAGNGYHAVAAPSPVAAYKPHTNYSPMPMAFSPSSEIDHSAAAAPTPGFQRQPSFGSSQYPPTYTSQPPYRGFSPAPSSPPPAFSAASPSEYATYNPHANTIPIPEPDNTRPPSLLQSGKKPTVNASSNF
ncbi:unnamed protein product [Penicillium nalgiovense]|uniref:Uncharacterized protein n=1 Tax=Penicillium nalgiovense TaxID=60175 RepID=A0A9W4HVW1_PENNA|nr:unnamed protein product [Penicillium nalgiovense]CAG7957852.1 unnamed protein product [Penicillium nalgiovense]CAG7973087.1 unnamed protein product [Penicillium nalgiovense]CAG7974583.1 unnamed protein product [Penicillium nalgiovense]CAG8063729.1 unnamed protein product [Penicillium nalgiovense]